MLAAAKTKSWRRSVPPSLASSSLPYPARKPGFLRSLYSQIWLFRTHQPQLGWPRSPMAYLIPEGKVLQTSNMTYISLFSVCKARMRPTLASYVSGTSPGRFLHCSRPHSNQPRLHPSSGGGFHQIRHVATQIQIPTLATVGSVG